MPKFSEKPQKLQTSDFHYFLNDFGLLKYYKEINKAGSKEASVDKFYQTFLRDIFLRHEHWYIEMERSPGPTTQRTDATILYMTQEKQMKVILCENKRREFASHSSVWKEALEQVVRYACLVRMEPDQREYDGPLYLTVNIGTYVRFYELPHKSRKAIDWAEAGGRCYELADDEAVVWRLWNILHDLVTP